MTAQNHQRMERPSLFSRDSTIQITRRKLCFANHFQCYTHPQPSLFHAANKTGGSRQLYHAHGDGAKISIRQGYQHSPQFFAGAAKMLPLFTVRIRLPVSMGERDEASLNKFLKIITSSFLKKGQEGKQISGLEDPKPQHCFEVRVLHWRSPAQSSLVPQIVRMQILSVTANLLSHRKWLWQVIIGSCSGHCE